MIRRRSAILMAAPLVAFAFAEEKRVAMPTQAALLHDEADAA